MLLLPAVLILGLFLPGDAWAWGAGTHLQLGTAVLASLPTLPAAVAAVIGAFPHDFLYGCIAADIIVGKKFTHYLLHCHRWQIGLKVLEQASTDAQRSCAYGYLAHLAADAVAHNYFVPHKTMRSFATLTLKHAYWEMRFENYVDKEIWEIGSVVARENYRENDALLRKVLADTLFSFGTNKRIFNSILLVNRLEQWQQALKKLNDTSRFVLEEEDREEYLRLTREAVFGILTEMEGSRFFRADPTGERALQAAEAMRKNLRLLYTSGKLTKEQAFEQLDEIKVKLRDAICAPDKLQEILAA